MNWHNKCLITITTNYIKGNKKMKNLLFVLCLLNLNAAEAAIIIDPLAGLTSNFSWDDGLGQIDGINGTAEIEWSITAATDSTLTTTAFDAFVVGDEFGLIFDGASIAWTSTFIDGSGYFHGIFDNLFLSAGVHTLSLEVTALAPGFTSGGAVAEFSPLTNVTVPAPTTFWLLIVGLIGFTTMRKKASNVSSFSA